MNIFQALEQNLDLLILAILISFGIMFFPHESIRSKKARKKHSEDE